LRWLNNSEGIKIKKAHTPVGLLYFEILRESTNVVISSTKIVGNILTAKQSRSIRKILRLIVSKESAD